LALVTFIFTLAFAAMAVVNLQPVDKGSSDKQDFVVEPSTSRLQLAKELKEKNLIRNDFFLFLYLKATKSTVLAGTYELSPSMSATVVAEKVSLGKFKSVKATLIEGWRATDIEKYLVEEKHLPQMTGFAKLAESHEGYLFPDTYELKVDLTQEELITLLRDNFKKRTEGLNFTPDLVILASIVEREAASDSDRAPIAQVYLNRLKNGMKLEADPTIQYAKGDWKAVTLAEYKSVISPYNTYLNEGLPPGPICNPGLASLKAVLAPEKNDYLFFFHAKGQTFFSTTYEEHAAKVKKNF